MNRTLKIDIDAKKVFGRNQIEPKSFSYKKCLSDQNFSIVVISIKSSSFFAERKAVESTNDATKPLSEKNCSLKFSTKQNFQPIHCKSVEIIIMENFQIVKECFCLHLKCMKNFNMINACFCKTSHRRIFTV